MNERASSQVERFEPAEPQPLFRPLKEPQPFRVECLPPMLQDGVRGIVGRVQCPEEIAIQSALAAVSLIVQAHVDVEMQNGQVRPTSLFQLTVAESGERKTSADNEAMAAVEKYEGSELEEYDRKFFRYRSELLAWEAAQKRILRNRQLSPTDIQTRLADLGPAPDPPPFPMLIVADPTYEGMGRVLAEGYGFAGLCGSEGGQFFGGYSMSADNKMKTAAGLNVLWDGKALKRARQGDGLSAAPGRRASLHLLLQPSIAAEVLSDSLLRSIGLTSRFLVVQPQSTMGRRKFREPSPDSEAAMERYNSKLQILLSLPRTTAGEKQNELAPRVLRLSSGAREVVINFSDTNEAGLSPDGEWRTISSFANKLAEHAVRIAGIFAFVQDDTATEIDEDTMRRAIILAGDYAREALRIFETGNIRPELIEAERLRLWILERSYDVVTLTQIYQLGPSAIRTKAKATDAVRILEEHGWLRRIEGGASIDGKHRRDAWRVNRGATAV